MWDLTICEVVVLRNATTRSEIASGDCSIQVLDVTGKNRHDQQTDLSPFEHDLQPNSSRHGRKARMGASSSVSESMDLLLTRHTICTDMGVQDLQVGHCCQQMNRRVRVLAMWRVGQPSAPVYLGAKLGNYRAICGIQSIMFW